MLVNENNSMPYMKSLSTCLNRIIADGYTEDFKIGETGLEGLQHNKTYKPQDISVVNFYRFEGQSDPDDNAILYVIETNDGTKGTLINSYGLYSDNRLNNFIVAVENFHKQPAQ